MTTTAIAHRLVELCRAGKNADAYAELFTENALSLDPEGMPCGRVEGRKALIAKTAQFEKRYGIEVSDPIVTSSHFVICMANGYKNERSRTFYHRRVMPLRS